MKRERVSLIILGLVFSLSACGGGGGSSPSAVPTAAPTLAPTPTPAPVGLSPASVSLIGTASQTVTVNEPGFNGSISIDASSCAGVASVSGTSVQGPSGTFTVTSGSQGGTCSINVAGQSGQMQALPVTVTITQGEIQ